MPLLRFYLAPNLLSSSEKKNLAKQLTEIYTAADIPAFFVDVVYIEVPKDSIYVGGEEAGDFVRICIEHIARRMATEERKQAYMGKLDAIIIPVFKPKNLRWEYHITETPRELWKVQSLVPPPTGSDVEQMWARENRAIPYE